MNTRLTNLLAAIAVVGILGIGALRQAQASIINVPITNFSFESPALATNGQFTNSLTPVPGWTWDNTAGGGNFGVYKLPDPSFAPKDVPAPDGNQVIYIFHSTIWQQTSATLTDGDAYELTIAAAEDSGATSSFTYALYSGSDFATGTLLKSKTLTATDSPADYSLSFADTTFTFGPSDPGYAALVAGHANENIIVAFTANNATGSSADVDNVRLLEIVPEPASLGLLACGSLLLLRRRRA